MKHAAIKTALALALLISSVPQAHAGSNTRVFSSGLSEAGQIFMIDSWSVFQSWLDSLRGTNRGQRPEARANEHACISHRFSCRDRRLAPRVISTNPSAPFGAKSTTPVTHTTIKLR